MDDFTIKRCNKCQKDLPATAEFFPPDKRNSDGLQGQCRECIYKRNAVYHGKNPDKVKAALDRFKAKNPGEIRAHKRNWKKRNPDKVRKAKRLSQARREASKRSLPDTFTPAHYDRMMEYWGGVCAITGQDGELHLDHWIPLSSPDCPGTIPTNILPLSAALNVGKWNRNPVKWLIALLGQTAAIQKLKEIEVYFEWIAKTE